MTVSCSRCNEEWERDPALEVVCPTCNSRIGYFCGHKRPSGHKVRFGSTLIHTARDRLAMDLGFLQRSPAANLQAVSATDYGQMSFL